MAETTTFKQQSRLWPALAFIFILVSIALLIALIVVVVERDNDSGATHLSVSSDRSTCGSGPNPNGNTIDLSDPDKPGPFHDLTVAELVKLQRFLQTDPAIMAVPSETATINSSYVYMVDLMPPKKAEVLKYLDGNGLQPPRQARVLMFRGDLQPQVVQEWACGPLPEVTKCELLATTARRNPVEFTVRPFSALEFINMHFVFLLEVDRQIGYILRESFGATFHDCGVDPQCLGYSFSPVGTALSGDINQRLLWVYAQHKKETVHLQSLDFALLLDMSSVQVSQWRVDKVWYNGALLDSMDALIVAYNTSTITKARVPPPGDDEMFGSLSQRGAYSPPNPQRPPQLVEPDGKRYSIAGRKATYLEWTFNFRMSSTNGPFLYDLRFKGERIAYEIGLSEISVFYAGGTPHTQTMNFLDSGILLGTHSKALIPGADCPDTATFINQTFISQYGGPPSTYRNAFCMFEQNNGYPLRRHLGYTSTEGGIYGGMLDSALTLRSILTIGNYDYVVDFILHQNGVVETRFMSTGFIMAAYNSEKERPYGFQLHPNIVGNLHHHISHFKVDLDVGGTSNRYETLDIHPEVVNTILYPNLTFHQIGFTPSLKTTETEALYKYNFDTPKYHVVHNNAKKTALDQIKAYRIQMNGMSKQLIPEGTGNENTAAWARHQLVVTRHKDDEFTSTSNYGMFDSLNPVVDFASFYEDDENIVDQDLVFWITCGFHHIPHTEDIPVTPTIGNHLSFFLLPYNYFTECPSMASRDAIFASHTDKADPTLGVQVNRHGQSTDSCVTSESTLEQDVKDDPDMIMETLRQNVVN